MRSFVHAIAPAIVTAVVGTAVAGATVEVVKIKDQSMLASFSTDQFKSCGSINSAVELQWNTSLIKSDGTTTQSVAILSLRYVDTCTGDDVTMSGFVENAKASVAKDLSRGHLDAVVPVSTDPDVAPVQTASVSISVDFTATGPATTIRDRSHSRGGGIITVNNFLVSSRPAVATGSATGTLPLIQGPTAVSLIGTQSSSAQIGKDGFGNITIVHKTP